MNLQTFNTQTLPPAISRGDKRPLLTINASSGVFRFNQAACKQYKIKETTRFSFHQDKAKPKDFFVEFNPEAGGYEFQKRTAKSSLTFGHRGLAEKLFSAIGGTGTIEIPISPKDNATGLHALITAAAGPSVTAKRSARRKPKTAP